MKENVLDVLVYLFENYIAGESEAAGADRDSLQATLIEAGFAPSEIAKAFDWLDELEVSRRAAAGDVPVSTTGPVRVYSTLEVERLDADCRGFLMYLEQSGVLDATRRELVLDRLLALDDEDLGIDDLKWVILLVLFKAPGQEAAYAWVESNLFDQNVEPVH